MYDKILKIENEDLQQMFAYREQRQQGKAVGWSFTGIMKKVFGFVLMISLVKMICFPTEAEIPEDPASLDQMEIQLTRQEFATISAQKTESGRLEAIRKAKLDRIHKIKAEKKKAAEIGKKRIQEYFEARVKGKISQQEILIGVKEDFFKYANRKGGFIKDVAEAANKMSPKWFPKQTQTDEEQDAPESSQENVTAPT